MPCRTHGASDSGELTPAHPTQPPHTRSAERCLHDGFGSHWYFSRPNKPAAFFLQNFRNLSASWNQERTPYANGYAVALDVHRVVAKRTLLRIYKQNSPTSGAICNLLHQRVPGVVNPHNATEQMHQWGVPNMAHNSINGVHSLQLLVALTTNDSLLTGTTTKDV